MHYKGWLWYTNAILPAPHLMVPMLMPEVAKQESRGYFALPLFAHSMPNRISPIARGHLPWER